jgi:hypothetical protein
MRPDAAKLGMLASLNSPNLLTQRLFNHRPDFTPAQNALPTFRQRMIRDLERYVSEKRRQ